MNNLLLLDLDGTVRRSRKDPAGFINEPLDQEIIPEAAAALERWTTAGAIIVACSNQAGVHAGYKTIGSAIDEMMQTMRLAPQIRSVFFSPDSDGGRCFAVAPNGSTQTLTPRLLQSMSGFSVRSFRKPACGMLLAAAHRFGASVEDCVFVGDRDEDRNAAISCGMDFMPETIWWASEPQPIKEAA